MSVVQSSRKGPERGHTGTRRARVLWNVCQIMTLLAAVLLLVFFSLDYSQASGWAGRLSADGSFERLTPDLYAALRNPARLAGVAALVLSAALEIWRQRSLQILENLIDQWVWFGRRFLRDTASFARDLRFERADWFEIGGVALLTVGAVLARMLFLTRPMAHDEAYTYVAFASRSWGAIISDYHLPNNHIFHTLLVKVSTGLLGIEPWAVRFPAFLAGVLCVPAVYSLAKRLYGRSTALVSAALVTALPVMILYSANARGYSLYILLSLLTARLAIYLKDHCNLAGWAAWVLLSALGFYTLPTMLYPFGMVVVWMLWSALVDVSPEEYGSRMRFIRYLAAAVAGVVVLTGLLYLPVIAWGTGWKSLVGNPFVSRLTWQAFPETAVSRVQDTAHEWMMDLPAWLGPLAVLGFGLSLVLHRKICRVKAPMQIAGAVWLGMVLLAQRPDAMARVWTFLIPFVAMWCSAGWFELLDRVRMPRLEAIRLGSLAAVLALAGLCVFTWQRTQVQYPSFQPYLGEMEQVVQYLKPRMGAGDIVIISSDDSPILWYYFRLYGIPDETVHHLEKHRFPFHRAFVVVSGHEGQTLETAVEKRGLDPQEFALESAVQVWQISQTVIYEIMAR